MKFSRLQNAQEKKGKLNKTNVIFKKGKNITPIKKCNREGGSSKVILNGILLSTATADSQLQFHGIRIM